jgi:hypothetical protein
MTQSELDLDLGTETMNCTAEEVVAVFAGLIREMRAAVPFITADERAALRHIMAHESGALTVAAVFPEFERDSDAHMALRRLRTAQFIRPAGRDVWELDQYIEIKPFARLVWDRLGEAAIFGDAPEAVAVEEIDLALPSVDEPADSKETVRLNNKDAKKGAKQWDDADVLDFLNDSSDTPG